MWRGDRTETRSVSGLAKVVQVLQCSLMIIFSVLISRSISIQLCFSSSGSSISSLPKVVLLQNVSGTSEQSKLLNLCLRSISIMDSSLSIYPMIALAVLSNNSLVTQRYFLSLMHSSKYLFLQQSWWYFSRTRQLTEWLLSDTMRLIFYYRLLIDSLRYLSISATISSQVALSYFDFYLKISMASQSMMRQLETASLSTVMLREAMSFWNSRYNLMACQGRDSRSMNL